MTAARTLAVCDASLDGISLIEASAGTGKTHTIATLFVRVLLEKGCEVPEILVVTYTKAATAELRQRIRQRITEGLEVFDALLDAGAARSREKRAFDPDLVTLIERSIARGQPLRDRGRLRDALRGFDESSIFTIHGFCQRVLTESSFETGADFDAELLESQRELVDEVVADYWARVLYDGAAPAVEHICRAGPDALSRFGQRVLANPAIVIVPDLDDDEVAAAFRACAEAEAPTEAALDRVELAFKAGFVRYLRRELSRRKRERRLLGFDDLLVRLHDAVDGPHGEALVARIRERYPVALIDEFQDTDPIQSHVFERVYDPGAKAPLTLFLIGDPKQAIYGFRGADVFSYARVARKTERFTLGTNYRSDPGLVQAVNLIFERARAPFWLPEIEFQPVVAAERATDALGGALAGAPALELLFMQAPLADPTPLAKVPAKGKRSAKHKPAPPPRILKGALTTTVPRIVAQEIVALLSSGATVGGRKVEPRDIAVLCRKNVQARAVQVELQKLGVPAVLDGDESVFDGETAEELERVLVALSEPADLSRLRAALVTTLLGENGDGLLELERKEPEWDQWLARFHRWHELWETHGVVQALYALLDDCSVAQRLLGLLDGERRLTDLMHLIELLHVEALTTRQGAFSLVAWFCTMRGERHRRAGMAADSMQIRLESDAHAVTLTTVHKSKGLAYPIVYCPFLVDGTLMLRGDAQYLSFHDAAHGGRATLDCHKGHADRADHEKQAEREALAEQLRLLYVALTRAKHRVSVVCGAFKEIERSAFGYLLHQDPEGDPAEATCARIAGLDDAAMREDLGRLAAASRGTIGLRTAVLRSDVMRYDARVSGHVLRAPPEPRVPRETVRASSFSQLARGGPSDLHATLDDALDLDVADEGLTIAPGPDPREPRAPVALADFPTGAARGRLIHSIYEEIDFRVTEAAPVEATAERLLGAYGMATADASVLGAALSRTLRTPIDEPPGLPSLSVVAPEDRLVELEFVFPVARAASTGSDVVPLSAASLGRVLSTHASSDAERRYAEKVSSLGFSALRGYLRGFIDLVVRHQGRYFVLDYKSNHLGSYARDYERASMQTAMFEHHYVLQYLLYTVALHRHLSLRLPGYDYERDFGGVYYLFVRGMAPEHARGTGVYRARPSLPMVRALSELLHDPRGAS